MDVSHPVPTQYPKVKKATRVKCRLQHHLMLTACPNVLDPYFKRFDVFFKFVRFWGWRVFCGGKIMSW